MDMKPSFDGTQMQPIPGPEGIVPATAGISPEGEESQTRFRFESLLTDISAHLGAASADQVDFEIGMAQRRVCENLGLAFSALWLWTDGIPAFMVLSHVYRASEGPPIPDRMEAGEFFPWCYQEAMHGRIPAIETLEDLPAAAARDLETFRHFGVKSLLNFPLRVGSEPVFGVLSFHNLPAGQQWTEPLVARLHLIAQVFANTILRKLSYQALRESEERLELAADSAAVGLWTLDLESEKFWLTDRTRSLFGFGADEEVNFDRFLGTVHPEDRGHVRRTLENVVRGNRESAVEYRIVTSDGSVRWMTSRGRLRHRAGAESPLVMGVSLDDTVRRQDEERLRATLKELQDLRDRLNLENDYLRKQIRSVAGPGAIVGESARVKLMLDEARIVAPTEAAVLITGETGTGKELLAQAIHDLSPRSRRTLVKVNCAALPAALIESELFGRERGAYTGALNRQIGRFELAHDSTIMLDEIGDLPLDLQVKLLRVLQDGTFDRLGSNSSLTTNARVIAATNRDLAAMIQRGEFREDLFHRLNVFPIEVPPLRDRVEDIPLLVWAFVEEFNAKMGRSIESIPVVVMDRLKAYSWPGNVRELRNLIERAIILCPGHRLNIEIPQNRIGPQPPAVSLEEVERGHIRAVLERTHWRISGKGGAAEILGLIPTTLHSRMKKLGIERPRG